MVYVKTETERWFDAAAVSVKQYFFFSSLALVVIFAWMEPAGAAGIGFAKGLVFWAIQIAILIPLLIHVQQLASHHCARQMLHNPWIQTALSGICAALLFVPMAYFLDALFAIPEKESSIGLIGGLLDEASGVVVPVTVTWLMLNAPWILQLNFSRKAIKPTTLELDRCKTKPSSEVHRTLGFVEELRRRASGDLISISSELHYVRVVTTDTQVMFLYNLKDAIEELSSDAGIHIHRSHWVSRAHVKDLSKRSGAFEVTLSNGKRLPVSRRKYSEVKQLLRP